MRVGDLSRVKVKGKKDMGIPDAHASQTINNI